MIDTNTKRLVTQTYYLYVHIYCNLQHHYLIHIISED